MAEASAGDMDFRKSVSRASVFSAEISLVGVIVQNRAGAGAAQEGDIRKLQGHVAALLVRRFGAGRVDIQINQIGALKRRETLDSAARPQGQARAVARLNLATLLTSRMSASENRGLHESDGFGQTAVSQE